MPEFRPHPPRDEAELLARAEALAGRPLRAVAERFGIKVPPDLRRDKGWIGNLLETALGATAKSRKEPDFPTLGIEMKTLPVTPEGRPRESTYVCTAPLDATLAIRWQDSWVRHKLARVLWVPIVTDTGVPPGDRVIGTPLMWTPSVDEEAALQKDWEELTELIAMGELWQLTAHKGQVLQIRPKGANSRDRAWALDDEGEWSSTTPRGFYLRQRFTRKLLEKHYKI